jgi:hypothetical protein
MTYPMMQHIPLESAYLCIDCSSIGNNYSSCPACASKVLMSLADILDRDVTSIEVERVLAFAYPRATMGTTTLAA